MRSYFQSLFEIAKSCYMITYFRILVSEVSVLNCAVMLYDCIFQHPNIRLWHYVILFHDISDFGLETWPHRYESFSWILPGLAQIWISKYIIIYNIYMLPFNVIHFHFVIGLMAFIFCNRLNRIQFCYRFNRIPYYNRFL